MKIQWFPGHMTKALRIMQDDVKQVDAIIYVLDARAPFSCVNPKFNEILSAKPVIFILNKTDLADEKETNKWKSYFSQGQNICITMNSTMTNASKILVEAIKKCLKDKLDKFARKGVVMTLRAMVIGVPNCGKSTLINNLCGKYKAITGDRPSVTRSTQWVKIGGGIEVLDTPGTLWPEFRDDEIAKNLAYINSIKDDVLDMSELVLDFIPKMMKYYREEFCKRYSLEYNEETTPVLYLEKICENRKFLLKGEPDYERGARAVLDDFRKCRIGKITLDKYDEVVRK